MYSIDVDSSRNLLTVDVSGFWTLATVEEFARDLGVAMRRLNASDQHVIVLGYDEADVAPGPVVEALRHLIVAAPKWIADLTAAMLAASRRQDEQATAPEPQPGVQGEGSVGCREGREDAGKAGAAV